MPLPLIGYGAYLLGGAVLASAAILVAPNPADPRRNNAQVLGDGLVAGGEAIGDGLAATGEAIGGVFSQNATEADEGANALPQEGTVVDACSNCQQPNGCSDIVAGMRRKNEALNDELRRYDPAADAQGGHTYFVNGVQQTTVPGGHYQEIRALQRGLKNDLQRYNRDRCYNGAPESDSITRRAAQQNVNRQIDIPPGQNFIPL